MLSVIFLAPASAAIALATMPLTVLAVGLHVRSGEYRAASQSGVQVYLPSPDLRVGSIWVKVELERYGECRRWRVEGDGESKNMEGPRRWRFEEEGGLKKVEG